MDEILYKLQGKIFNIPKPALEYLNNRYLELISKPLLEAELENNLIISAREFIQKHRSQFNSDEYLNSRIDDPREGTIDHLHSEITSDTAVQLCRIKKLNTYAEVLVQVAGHLHDSDRSYSDTRIDIDVSSYSDSKLYAEYKSRHSENSCSTVMRIYNELKMEGCICPYEFLQDLKYIILRHETGGDRKSGELKNTPSFLTKDLNLNELCDIVMIADSISYIDANIITHWEEINKDKNLLKRKINFMFSRLPEIGKSLITENIINSNTHIFGINPPRNEDIFTIRSLIISECTV